MWPRTLTRLPYADATFDAAVSGWVLEHLPDPRPGLRELTRVLRPGGKLLLLATEDTLTGAMCSRLWHCRTYNRTNCGGFVRSAAWAGNGNCGSRSCTAGCDWAVSSLSCEGLDATDL